MIEILVKLKKSFSVRSYIFGCSKVNDSSTVQNWQVGNNTLLVSESGIWYCFAKKKNSNKLSVFVKEVNCSGGVIMDCVIMGLPPYTQSNSPIASCTITGLSPYSLTGTTPTPEPTLTEVPTFLFWGESNAGTRNALDTASTGDLGVRAGIRIFNNSTNTLQAINIPSNSSYGENDCTPNTAWGWEVPAANFFQTGTPIASELIILKVAQGGALIGQWNDDIQGGYYQIAQSRINALKAQLLAEGKKPKWYVFYSQGINNATDTGKTITDNAHFPNLTGIEYWGAATTAMLAKIKGLTSSTTRIGMTKFFGTFGTYLNAKIDAIVSGSNGSYFAIATNDLGIQSDGLHLNASATKTAFNRLLTGHALTQQAPAPSPSSLYATAPAAIVIPEETEWNRFRPEILPSINVPMKVDTLTGRLVPDKLFTWWSYGRNMFGYVANQGVTNPITIATNEILGMKRIGLYSQAWNYTTNCLENTYNGDNQCNYTENQTGLDATKEVMIGGSLDTQSNETANAYAQRALNDLNSQASRARVPLVDNKYRGWAWLHDGENEYTGGDSQRSADAKVNAHYKLLQRFVGRVGDLYNAPNNNLGYMDGPYFAGNTKMYSWYGKSQSGEFVGVSQDDNPAILSVAEMATYYEDVQPEGSWMKDQNGQDWIRICHFGTNVGTGIYANEDNSGNTATARHWATQYAGIVERNAEDAHATGHKHYISFKPNNQIGIGYMHSESTQTGKTTFEQGKWGAEYYNNPSVKQTAGDTPMPAWMIEGAVMLCMFGSADGVIYWNSAWHQKLYPITKTGNARNNEHQVDPTLDRVPRDFNTYMLKGQVRLGQPFLFPDNTSLSFLDLVAESDTVYQMKNTEYSIDSGVTYVKPNPLAWQTNRIPPCRVVVNTRLKKAFIFAQESYNECSSRNITSLKVKISNTVYDMPILPNNIANMIGVVLP